MPALDLKKKKKVCWLTSPICVFELLHTKYAELHLPWSCLLLIWRKQACWLKSPICLWIASSKVSWLKSFTQLVSMNCIIQKYADLHHPSSWLLLIWRNKLCWLKSTRGVFELLHPRYADLHQTYSCLILTWKKYADLHHP